MLFGLSKRSAMTLEQQRVFDAIASGPRNDVPRPFLAMLDTPVLAEAIQEVGARIRFSGGATPYQREVATLATADAFGSRYEFDYHLPLARIAGVPEQVIEAAQGRGSADGLQEVDRLIIMICRGAVTTRAIQPDHVSRLIELTSAEVASTIVAIAGYYQMLALFLAAAGSDA